MQHLYFKLHRKPDKLDPATVETWDYENVVSHRATEKYYILMMKDKSAFIPLHWIIEVGEIKDEPKEEEKCKECGQALPKS